MVSYTPSASELQILYIALYIAIGICFGSFANVCIYRLPNDENLFKPSHCLHCLKPIPYYLNVPIISYLALRGRSNCCQKKLSLQYPIVELVGGLGALASFYLYGGLTLSSIYAFVFLLSLLIIFFTDLNEYIIPDIITYPIAVLGVFLTFIENSIFEISIGNSIFTGVFAGAIFYLTAKIFLVIKKQEGMGMGDVKMIAMIGFWMGIENTLLTIILSALLGSILGITLILFKKMDRSAHIPFGSFISIGCVIVWINSLTVQISFLI